MMRNLKVFYLLMPVMLLIQNIHSIQNIAKHPQYTCPAFSTILINTYRFPAPLYVDGDVIYSNEGTTQEDPLAMPFYVWSTIPLIRRLPNNVTQDSMQMMQMLMVKFHICICGGTSFHYLDHILAIFLMHLRLGLLSKNST